MNSLLGVYEKSMPGFLSLSEKMAIAQSVGFDFMEISIDESDEKLSRLNWTAGERADLCNRIADNNFALRSMCLSGHRRFPMGSEDPFIASRSLDIMQRAIDLACDLGIRVIQLAGYDTYYDPSNDHTRENFLQNLQKAVEMAAKSCVTLAFETMETPFMDTVEKAMLYIDQIHSPFLQIYPDIGNLTNSAVLYGHDVIEDLRLGSGHIVMAHLKETKPGHYRDLFYGEGHVDFPNSIAYLQSEGVRAFVGELWYQTGIDPVIYLTSAYQSLSCYFYSS